MDRQTRYDAMLVAIPLLLALAGGASAVGSGPGASALAFVGTVAAAAAVGQVLFVAPPTAGPKRRP